MIDYPDEHYIDLQSDEHGLLARIVVRLLVVEGKRVRWAVVLQVRRQDGRFRDIVRYDDWHGYLHRHDPRGSSGQPGKSVPVEPIPGVDPLRQAVGELVTRADGYIALAALRDDERAHAAGILAVWLVENAVQVTADYPTGTNWVPVAIDDETRRLGVLVQAPGTTSSLAEIPMLAVA